MYVRHLSLADFRSWPAAEVAFEPGPSVLVGPNGAGQDQPGRGARLRRHARVAPGRHRRAAGPGGRGPGRGADRGGQRRPRAAGRAGDQPGPGQPGPAQPVAGAAGPRRARRAALGAVRARGPRPGPRRPGRAAPVPRRAAGAARPALRRGPGRLRAGAQAAQRAAEDRAGAAAAGPAAPATCAPSTSGTATWPGTARSCSPAGSPWSGTLAPYVAAAYDEVARGGGPAEVTYSCSLGDALPAGRRRVRSCWRRRCWPSWPGCGRRSSSAASRWSARTATTWCSRSAAGRPRATPATASPGRTRWRCGWRRTSCWPRTAPSRCWCSTTSSPSSTPPGAAGWPTVAGRAEQVLVTAAVADDVPEELLGARYDVADGEVRRVR